MNLGWYEIMDRVAVLQNSLEDNIGTHHTSTLGADEEFDQLIDKAQSALYDIYNYAHNNWYESCENGENNE